MRADQAVFAEFELAPRTHNRLLPLMLEKVVADAGLARREINYCAFTNGPGAFTGIRIGAAQAQGIGLALGIPLIPLSTLQVIAQGWFDESTNNSLIAAIDARMDEIYWGRYDRGSEGLAVLRDEEYLSAVRATLPLDDVDAIIGSGAAVLQQPDTSDVQIKSVEDYLPRAVSMLKLAQHSIQQGQLSAAASAPINYLRNKVAEKARPR